MNKQSVVLIILFFISITFFVSCNSVTDSSKKDENYFPLKVNNSWSYYSLNDTLTRNQTISKKLVINSREYYIYSLSSSNYPGDTIRIDDNHIYRRYNDYEVLWFDFNLDNNQKYNFLDYQVTVTRNLTVKCKAGTFNNCIGFYFDIPHAVDEEHQYIFAKGIGIVRINSGWFDFYLGKYNIFE